MTAYCPNCEKEVVPKVDDEWPFSSYCPDCAGAVE